MKSQPQARTLSEVLSGGAAPIECDMEPPRFRPDEAANDLRMSRLARTIEEEIIPRLMLAHRAAAIPMPPRPAGTTTITPDDVRHFAKLALSHDEDCAFMTILEMRARDVSVEKIYLDLLAPTARYLGELWEEDLCSFTDVTVGLGRLQRVLRELSPSLGQGVEHAIGGRRILLLPGPGEQHTFGLVMVAEFFRTAGWDVVGGAWVEGADAPAMVADEWFDVIGFSLGAEARLQTLADTITAVRHAACNREIAVLVGGPLFGLHPEYLTAVGADGMTIDGREAPLLAESLITQGMLQRG